MTPYVYLAAAPKDVSRVQTLTRREGVRQLLEQPPYTRHDGWNLVTLDHDARMIGLTIRWSVGAMRLKPRRAVVS